MQERVKVSNEALSQIDNPEKLGDKTAIQAEANLTGPMHEMLATPVGETFLNPPITIQSSATLSEAGKLMKENLINTLLVERGSELGIITTPRLRDAVLIDELPIGTAVGDLAMFNPITTDSDIPLSHAMMLMSKRRIHRAIVTEDGKPIGILEMMNLLSFLNNHTHLVTLQIERAQTPDELKTAADGFLPLIKVLHNNGTRIALITQLVSEINHRLFTRLFEFLAPPELLENSCLIVMGSEGRKEQVLHTDQDNALIIRDGFNLEHARLVGEAFTEALIDFGFPPCPGKMMINNPKWCKHQSKYIQDITSWVSKPSKQSLLELSAFIDSARVCGDKNLLLETKDHLFEYTTNNNSFFSQFALPIDNFEIPLGLFHRLIVESGEHKGEIDIKKGGLFPIVHGARSLCLEKGIFKTNTVKRLEALTDARVLDKDFTNDLIYAFKFLLGLKLRAGLISMDEDRVNFIQASDLNKMEKDMLKDSLILVKEFKSLIRHHFKLERF